MSLLQRGKSFESESEIAGSVQTSLFSTVHDALAYAVCVVAVVASVAESSDDDKVTR